jgi:hypothetical protein
MSYHCHHCGNELTILDRVGRGDTCPSCHSDLHCCLNCIFYDPQAYNECREPNAERVLEKDRANFCDYFSFAEGKRSLKKEGEKKEVFSKLDELFKKG